MPTKLPAGRPPDPETQAEAQALAERFVAKRAKRYLEVLDAIAMSDEAPPDQRRMAISTLFERGLGKAAIPEKDSQLGQLEKVLKEVARIASISSNKSNTRIIEVSPRGSLTGSEDGSDSSSGSAADDSQESGAVDYSETAGDS